MIPFPILEIFFDFYNWNGFCVVYTKLQFFPTKKMASHCFWALKLSPKKTGKVKIPPYHVLHITHAAVEKRAEDTETETGRFLSLLCTADHFQKIVVCTLYSEVGQDRLPLNLRFAAGPLTGINKHKKGSKSSTSGSKGGGKNNKQSNQPSQKLIKRGRAKRKQPELLQVSPKLLPPQQQAKRRSRKGKNFELRVVAEFTTVGNWGRVVYLSGYSVNSRYLHANVDRFPSDKPDIPAGLPFFGSEEEELDELGEVVDEGDKADDEDDSELKGKEKEGEGEQEGEEGGEEEEEDLIELKLGTENNDTDEDQEMGSDDVNAIRTAVNEMKNPQKKKQKLEKKVKEKKEKNPNNPKNQKPNPINTTNQKIEKTNNNNNQQPTANKKRI